MNATKLVRDEDFFLTIDLVGIAAVTIGIDPMNPRLSLSDCVVDKTGVTFASGTVVRWNELDLGNLLRVDDLLVEYCASRSPIFKEEILSMSGLLTYSPNDAQWFFKESAKERLFRKWGNQIGACASSWVL